MRLKGRAILAWVAAVALLMQLVLGVSGPGGGTGPDIGWQQAGLAVPICHPVGAAGPAVPGKSPGHSGCAVCALCSAQAHGVALLVPPPVTMPALSAAAAVMPPAGRPPGSLLRLVAIWPTGPPARA